MRPRVPGRRGPDTRSASPDRPIHDSRLGDERAPLQRRRTPTRYARRLHDRRDRNQRRRLPRDDEPGRLRTGSLRIPDDTDCLKRSRILRATIRAHAIPHGPGPTLEMLAGGRYEVPSRESGGTGRRAGFRILWLIGGGGSVSLSHSATSVAPEWCRVCAERRVEVVVPSRRAFFEIENAARVVRRWTASRRCGLSRFLLHGVAANVGARH